jgi:hypothetical protein
MKARTAATLITDHKRKIVAARIPDLHVTDGINYTTELHATPRMRPVLKGLISESEKASALTSLSAGALSPTLHSRDRWSQRNLRLKETNQGYPKADIAGFVGRFLSKSGGLIGAECIGDQTIPLPPASTVAFPIKPASAGSPLTDPDRAYARRRSRPCAVLLRHGLPAMKRRRQSIRKRNRQRLTAHARRLRRP